MSFLNFSKSLLLHPIAFADNYFEKGRARPQFQHHLQKVLYKLPLLLSPLKILYSDYPSLDNLEKTFSPQQSLNFSLDFAIGMLIYLGILYLFLPFIYKINYWCFRQAVSAGDGDISKEKGKDIALYLVAIGNFFGFVWSPLFSIVLTKLVMLRNTEPLFIKELLLFLPTLVRMFIQYNIIKKRVNARTWLVVLVYILLELITWSILSKLMIISFIPAILFMSLLSFLIKFYMSFMGLAPL